MSADALKESLSDLDAEQKSMVLALGIMLGRIKTLSQEDGDDLFLLFIAYRDANSAEERVAANDGMMEILEQQKVSVKTLPMNEGETKSPKLKKWIAWVSKKIHDLREERKLSQVDLASRAGLPQSHVSRLENGKHSPSRYTLEKLADAMGVDVSEFDPSVD